jgi:hypothetical protein
MMSEVTHEPYENTLSVERLRVEVRECWDENNAFFRDLVDLPEVPSHETLRFLSDAGMKLPWPETINIGKELQSKHPWGSVPAKTERECAAGLWVMIREGILARRQPTATITTLTSKLAIAEAALELFSECADEYNSEAGDWLDDHWASHKDNITVGDLRRARAALAAIRAGDAPTPHDPMKGTGL